MSTNDLRDKPAWEATLAIPDVDPLEVRAVVVREGLSDRVKATVTLVSGDDVDFGPALGQACTLEISGLGTRKWTLHLAEARFKALDDGVNFFELTLYDPFWLLSLTTNTRKYRNLDAQEIVSLVLTEGNIVHQFELTQPLNKRKYTAQYREKNLAYVERILEYEGLYYYFDEAGQMHIGDASHLLPFVHDERVFEVREASGAQGDLFDIGVFEARRGARVTTGAVTAGDYNWKHPGVSLRETAFGDADVQFERYEYPAGFRAPDQGSRIAKLRVEAYRAQSQYLKAESNVLAMGPGNCFKLGDEIGGAFAGDWLVEKIEHRLAPASFSSSESGAAGATSYTNTVTAIPRTRPYHPVPRHARPVVSGTHTAMVRGPAGEEIHTDKYGRFRAQLHWDREAVGTDEDSRWFRPMQETSSSMVLARVGWEMYINYIDGDPDRPFGLGRGINGQMTPTYSLPANKNAMTIHTPSSPATGGFSEIKMEDSSGSQMIYVRAEKDYDAKVRNDKSEVIGNNETHTVGTDMQRSVYGSQFMTVGVNEDLTFDASAELRVKGNRTVTVGATEDIDIGAGKNQTIKGADTETVGAVRTSLVGSPKMPDFKGMAKSAVMGLIPGPVNTLMSGDPMGALMASGQSSLTNAANAVGKSLANGESGEQALSAAQGQLTGGVNSTFGLNSSTGGLPSSADLKNQFSSAALEQQFTGKLKGAVSTATGGLSDIAMKFKKGQNGKREGTFGWGEADQLVSLFSEGGITRTAKDAVTKMIGGAYIQAAASPIKWSSGGVMMETIGALKFTKSLKDIKEDIKGRLQVTTLGMVLRNAKTLMSFTTIGPSSITSALLTEMAIAKDLEILGEKGITIKSGTEIKLSGGGAAEIVMSPGDAGIKTPKLGLDAKQELHINGKKLNLTKL